MTMLSGATQARSSTTQAVAPSWTLPRPDGGELADVYVRASRDGAKKLHISNKHKLAGPPAHQFNTRPHKRASVLPLCGYSLQLAVC